jgi:hypothetical protein
MPARTARSSHDAQWRSSPDTSWALVIRTRVDEQFLAVEQQHTRIVAFCRSAVALASLPSSDLVRGLSDIDFFLLSLRRLQRVCELVRRSALPTGPLRQAMATFDRQVLPVTGVRNALEHLDATAVNGNAGFGYSIGEDRVIITHNGTRLDTMTLFNAAQDVHAAIRLVVDPIAAADVHGQHPIIVLPGSA